MSHLTAAERGNIETLLQEQYTDKKVVSRLSGMNKKGHFVLEWLYMGL